VNARRLVMVLTLVSLGLGACGGGGGGTGNEVPAGQSLVVITTDIDAGLPQILQIWVAAHSGGAGDVDLYFPPTPGGPIASGSTLGILVPNTITGLLDLVLRGLDANHTAVARGTGQAMIVPDGRAERTIQLSACPASGC
jgi:hypothetical protein